MPPLRWEPCGPGCERADVVQGIGDSATIPVLTTHPQSDWAEVFLRHLGSRLVRWYPGTTEYEIFVERIDGDVCKVDVGGGP